MMMMMMFSTIVIIIFGFNLMSYESLSVVSTKLKPLALKKIHKAKLELRNHGLEAWIFNQQRMSSFYNAKFIDTSVHLPEVRPFNS